MFVGILQLVLFFMLVTSLIAIKRLSESGMKIKANLLSDIKLRFDKGKLWLLTIYSTCIIFFVSLIAPIKTPRIWSTASINPWEYFEQHLLNYDPIKAHISESSDNQLLIKRLHYRFLDQDEKDISAFLSDYQNNFYQIINNLELEITSCGGSSTNGGNHHSSSSGVLKQSSVESCIFPDVHQFSFQYQSYHTVGAITVNLNRHQLPISADVFMVESRK